MLEPELPPRIYASLKALCCLAKATGPLQAHEIASSTGLPPPQTAKILQMMTWAGFVESRRGTKGGFWLVRPANHIRVSDVLDFFVHRTHETSEQVRDPILEVLADAMTRCQKDLMHITLADLAEAACCERPAVRSKIPVQRARKRKHSTTDSIEERNDK